ncbi:MAG TPA: NAD-dependent epimerase/dehydratase family protein [Ilumatobacteraceae bacterium]
MRGQRVLVSGMGGELGSLVASRLEAESWVGSILGIDVDPPRRRLRRSEFHLIDPADRERIVDVVTAFDPHVLVHLAVWEPDARAGTTLAKRLTREAATSIVGAAAECPSLEAIVVRSGIEIYGRGRGSLTRPDEDAPIRPTSEYGRMVADIEATANTVGARVGVAVSALRLAPVLGPHVPSPLGRILRQSVVPFSLLADSPFTVILDSDAANAFVAAAAQQLVGPLNVVAPGAITTMQAIRRGRRLPLPLVGPEWRFIRQVSFMLGAPMPEHVMELIHRGRLADGRRLMSTLGVAPHVTTHDVIDRLFEWEAIVRIAPRTAA